MRINACTHTSSRGYPSSKLPLLLFRYVLALVVALLKFSYADAWVATSPNSSFQTRGVAFLSSIRHHGLAQRSQTPGNYVSTPLERASSFGTPGQATTTARVCQSRDGKVERRSLRPLEAVVMSSWKDNFASLRNDASDPWSAAGGSHFEEEDGRSAFSASVTQQQDEERSTAGSAAEVKDNGRQVEEVHLAVAMSADGSQEEPASTSTRSNNRAPQGTAVSTDDEAADTNTLVGPVKGTLSSSRPPLVVPEISAIGSVPASQQSAEDYQDNDDQNQSRNQAQRRAMADEAAEIMASRGESDSAAAHRAYLLFDADLNTARTTASASAENAATLSPPILSLTRSTAAALLSWVRCKTAGNGLVVADDGQVATSDTAEKRELWTEHAPTILRLLQEVGEKPGSDPEVGI